MDDLDDFLFRLPTIYPYKQIIRQKGWNSKPFSGTFSEQIVCRDVEVVYVV